MYLCYIDESGTADIPGNTSHYVLAGLSIPNWHWKGCENDISRIKQRYGLADQEIHVGWILRSYIEQSRVQDFEKLSYDNRRYEVEKIRKATILKLQASQSKEKYRQTKKNFERTRPYIHLTMKEREKLVEEVANLIGSWGFARLFAECIDKIHFDPSRALNSLDEQAFEQVVSRFEHFLNNKETPEQSLLGMLIHDNNQTVAKRHTELMKRFHKQGTLWTDISHIIETPLFVDSSLTSMVQVSDLCAYALRRYLENDETRYFDPVFKRADRKGVLTVGIRHFTSASCACQICTSHKFPAVTPATPIARQP